VTKNKKIFRNLTILILIALISVTIIFFVSNTISFLTKEELAIVLTPKEILLNTHYNEEKQINISFVNENFAWCESFCSYELFDISRNKSIEKKDITLPHKTKVDLQYSLNSFDIGKGQKIYSFNVQCNNKKTTVCRTQENKVQESSLITLGYDISEQEKTIVKEVKELLENDFIRIKEIDTLNKENEFLLQNKTQRFFDNLNKKQNKINQDWFNFKRKNEQFVSLWEKQAYLDLSSMYKGYEFDDNYIFDMRQNIFDDIDIYNNIIFTSNKVLTNNSLNQYGYFKDINEPYNKLINIYENVEEIENLSKIHTIFIDELEKLNINYTLKANLDILKKDFILKKFRFLLGVNDFELNFNENIVYDEELNRICNEKSQLITDVETHNFLYNETNSNVQIILSQMFENSIIANNKTRKLLEISNKSVFINRTQFILNFDELSQIQCSTKNHSIVRPLITKESIIKKVVSKPSDINLTLNEHKTKCCTFGKCKECCFENCQAKYPVLLLHGHSFHIDDKVEASLKTMSKLQQKLEQDGYINAGEINIGDNYDLDKKGYLGRMNTPISIRSTYYFINTYDIGLYTITAQKTDRIENYAIRLREIIDQIKFKTGAEKINIVAHSMGGLVTREFINLFGENNIGKVVFIAVPHNGFTENIVKLCKITGANSECEDMAKGSVFLNRLNAKQSNIEVPVVNIIGQGCANNGDGILMKEDGFLSFGENVYVEGKCEDYLKTEMHNKMINPEIYPEVYDIVVNSLK